MQDEMDDVDMPDTNVGSGNTPNVGSTPDVGSLSSGSSSNHPLAGKHDHVMNIQD